MPSNVNQRLSKEETASQARQVIGVFQEISALLNAEIDPGTLSVCVSLIENGVNPEALASVVRELKKEQAEAQKEDRSQGK